MKKLIAVSILLLLAVARQSFGGDIPQGLTETDIASSDFYAAEALGASANKVAIVDKSGLHYADPIAAMEELATWCGVPSEANRCMIRILPGVYNLGINTLYMEPYVDIEGSGENATKLEGHSVYGVVKVSGNSELRYLTVEDSGDAGLSVAVTGGEDDNDASKKLTNVTIISVKGTGLNVGIYYRKLGFPPLGSQTMVISNVEAVEKV